jgi:hypothetical protein
MIIISLVKIPSFLRRQESYQEYRDIEKNIKAFGDSCLRRNDGGCYE